ncbi:calcium-dependent protein kinase 34-like [Selaginella moellendorffii]|uniref:calcium-dependent protein kinase 34-like n=1 Tax=Selaginella moellendorffii TaxID=88036 RepID=UPI000D1CB135|nr:calcium-dependent protein kinase 34-like [Selaginella moellendorffii]|eukprot:XP_024516381.1 calcium-dependent protein kinase 34-like [Selaginella moellendorffii]
MEKYEVVPSSGLPLVRALNNNKIFCCRTVSVTGDNQEFWELRNEIRILTLLKGTPGVMELMEVVREPTRWHLIMEPCEDHLYERLKSQGKMGEREAALLVHRMAGVLHRMHFLGIFRYNEILVKGEDLDDVRFSGFDDSIVLRRNYREEITVDIRWLGYVLILLLTNIWLEDQPRSFNWRIMVPPGAAKLIQSMLDDRHLTAAQVKNHPWVLKYVEKETLVASSLSQVSLPPFLRPFSQSSSTSSTINLSILRVFTFRYFHVGHVQMRANVLQTKKSLIREHETMINERETGLLITCSGSRGPSEFRLGKI